MPEVLECYHVTGDFDYILKVAVRSRADLQRFILERLTPVPGIARVNTSLMLGVEKVHHGPAARAVRMKGERTTMIEDLAATGATPGMAAWETIGAHIAEREGQRRDVMRHMKFDTIAVHGVYDAQAALAKPGRINEPLFLSPAQHFAEADQMETALAHTACRRGRPPRIAIPTVHYLEETLALLETYGSDVRASACATASGMAAIFMASEPFVALDPSLPPPNIVATAKCYGGSSCCSPSGTAASAGSTFAGCANRSTWMSGPRTSDAGTRFVYGEMPSNPAVAVFDIPAVAALAHAAGVPSIVDSAIATPALLRPSRWAQTSWSTLSKSLAGSGMASAGPPSRATTSRARAGREESTPGLREP